METVPFDPHHAPSGDLAALHAFTSAVRAELLPDDSLTPLEEAVAVWRATSAAADVRTWLAREPGGAVVARGYVVFARAGPPELASGSVEVLATRRGRGLARTLMAPIAAAMREAGRSRLAAITYAHAPGGAALMRRLGGEPGLEMTVHQLRLEALDPALVRAWLARGDGAYDIGFWDGPYPESDLEAVAALKAVMGTAPMGTLDVGETRPTGAFLRQAEALLAARGTRRWTAYARERTSGRFAGYTEITWLPRAPELLHQGDTGVFPEHRGRGLGARLKAEMLERVRRENPRARLVRTMNADANDAMLAINRALGFQPYLQRTVWQAPLAGIEEWLAGVTRT